MPICGGYAPFPRRFGGRKTRIKTITASLQAQLGPAQDTTDTTGLVFLRLNATARAIAAAWGQNARMANQWDPQRVTDFLGRWEKILALPVSPSDSLTTRRKRVAVARARVGEAMPQVIRDTCVAYLGPCFVSIVNNINPSSANVWTPAGWPMGQHAVLPTDPTWYSTVAYVASKVAQPSTMGDAEFYATVSSVMPTLDAILPATTTFEWYREDISGAPGFFLDDTHNLDDEAFDS